MQVPTTPAAIADAMDPWEAVNGPTDLYDQLVTHLGETVAAALWVEACYLYDDAHTPA